MIFMEYLRILGTENTAGGQAPGHEGGVKQPDPKWIEVSVLKCHPWIGTLAHTLLEEL